MAVVLAVHGATFGLITGVVLYFLIEKTSLFTNKSTKDPEEEKAS